MTHKLSNQAVGSIMMALQKAILDQEDITEMLKSFNLQESVDGLIVENPPNFQVSENTQAEEVGA
jgi:5,10-methylene-tetrahydrofolate dehydrogenase/methenyl tetrahydrofolate cyclohydrolase